MRKFSFILIFLLVSHFSNAATVDTITVYSNSMNKNIKAVVVLPAAYSTRVHFPAVYLLHGYSGDFSNWIKKVPSLQQLADNNKIIIVCPDGAYSSWYFDSPIDSSYRYETFITKELIHYIDSNYQTISNRKARAITGLSMGGHGGLFLGIRHQDVFGACGSMSGGVDLLSSVGKFDIAKRIGDTTRYLQNWKDLSVINQIEKTKTDSLSVIFDCGTEDFFYETNKSLHQKMLQLKIKHDYIERPGKHDWNYWANSVKYQILFFEEYFNKGK
jgi:S-formylglutathione hydrolase FrmB